MDKRKNYIFIASSWLTILLLWQLLSLYIANAYLFPSVPQLFLAVFRLFAEPHFASSILSTLFRGIIGMLFAIFFSLLLAWGASCDERFRAYLHPFLTMFRSVPVISFLFLFLIWFSPEQIPLVMALITMMPILIENLTTGLMKIDRSLLEMGHIYSFSLPQKLKHIVYPAVSPYFFSGLISAVGLGWKAIIMGEALAQPNTGIGVMIRESHGYIEIPRLVAWTVIAVLISYGMEFLLKKIEPFRFSVSFAKKDDPEKKPVPVSGVIKIDCPEKSFGDKLLFSDLYMDICPGEAICMMAPSGYGKTTLLRILSGLERSGNTRASLARKYTVALLFQDGRLLPGMTVWENVALPRSRYMLRDTARMRVLRILKQFGIDDCADRYPETLSGGERQRVALARLMFFPASVYLLDEPFQGIDSDLKRKIMNNLLEWRQQECKTVLYVTHHKDETWMADKVVRFE